MAWLATQSSKHMVTQLVRIAWRTVKASRRPADMTNGGAAFFMQTIYEHSAIYCGECPLVWPFARQSSWVTCPPVIVTGLPGSARVCQMV